MPGEIRLLQSVLSVEGERMSIMVKGMEMPKNCKNCRFWMLFLGRYLCFAQNVEVSDYTFEFMSQNRLPNCPLVEVPSDARLIDADRTFSMLDRALSRLVRGERNEYR